MSHIDIEEYAALEDARHYVMDKAKGGGTHCPICEQFVKVYRRSINSTMARQLIQANNIASEAPYFHTRDIVLNNSCGAGDFSKLKFWGLIKEKSKEPKDIHKRSSGLWMITVEGHEFLKGLLNVPMYALVYNQKFIGFEGKNINIVDALGEKFDYTELMRR